MGCQNSKQAEAVQRSRQDAQEPSQSTATTTASIPVAAPRGRSEDDPSLRMLATSHTEDVMKEQDLLQQIINNTSTNLVDMNQQQYTLDADETRQRQTAYASQMLQGKNTSIVTHESTSALNSSFALPDAAQDGKLDDSICAADTTADESALEEALSNIETAISSGMAVRPVGEIVTTLPQLS